MQYYHRPWRVWVSYRVDNEGYQVAECDYSADKDESAFLACTKPLYNEEWKTMQKQTTRLQLTVLSRHIAIIKELKEDYETSSQFIMRVLDTLAQQKKNANTPWQHIKT